MGVDVVRLIEGTATVKEQGYPLPHGRGSVSMVAALYQRWRLRLGLTLPIELATHF